MSRMCPELTSHEKSLFDGVRYHGIVCASVLLSKSLSPYYVTNITDAGYPFTAVIEMTSLVNKQELDGNALVYLPRYVAPNDELFDHSDVKIEHEFLSGLQRMHPALSLADVKAVCISRVRHVFALPTLGYSDRLPPIVTSVPGLYSLNSAQIVNGILNVNETIKLANDFVANLNDSPSDCQPNCDDSPDERAASGAKTVVREIPRRLPTVEAIRVEFRRRRIDGNSCHHNAAVQSADPCRLHSVSRAVFTHIRHDLLAYGVDTLNPSRINCVG